MFRPDSHFTPSSRLKRSFFNRCTLTVAEELIGKILVYKEHVGIITETEAYMGFNDPASHAYRGKTKRTEIMFGPPGFSYVYLIYGMYHCLNVVTEKKDYPAAVLIRGLRLQDKLLDGPGKMCRHLGITRDHNAIDMITSDELWIASSAQKHEYHIITTPRIGIRVGQDKLWRFLCRDTHMRIKSIGV